MAEIRNPNQSIWEGEQGTEEHSHCQKTFTNTFLSFCLVFGCLDFWVLRSRRHFKKGPTQMKSAGMPGTWHTRKMKQACLAYTYTNFRSLATLKSVFVLFTDFCCEGQILQDATEMHYNIWKPATASIWVFPRISDGQRILSVPHCNEL